MIRTCPQCSKKESSSSAARYQDKWYGKGVRVFSYALKKESFMCTVCGFETKAKMEVSKDV
jgi:transcription elongation factor Elf1